MRLREKFVPLKLSIPLRCLSISSRSTLSLLPSTSLGRFVAMSEKVHRDNPDSVP